MRYFARKVLAIDTTVPSGRIARQNGQFPKIQEPTIEVSFSSSDYWGVNVRSIFGTLDMDSTALYRLNGITVQA